MFLIFYFYFVTQFFGTLHAFCPSQCTCIFHGRSDGTGTRSVLCNDPDMYDIPVNIPVDTVKLRIEKTVIRRISTEAFYYLVDLKYLWMTYNSISSIDSSSFYNLKQLHELRLDGNMLSIFPWESLLEMPKLRTLDLHNNKIASIPAVAALYLKNITYLDVSSNKLTTLPSDLLDIWPSFSEPVFSADPYSSRVILGLQDNPWFCDCRISKLIELSKIMDPQVIFLDPQVICNGPESLTGILFQKAELEQCLKPSVMTSATKITSPLGSNVLLRCDATGYPTPQLTWSRMNSTATNYTVIQESPTDGVRWSILSMNGISYKDAGEYRCKAKNLAGISEASVAVVVVGFVTTTGLPQRFGRIQGADQTKSVEMEANEEEVTISTIWSPEILTSTAPSTETTAEPTAAPTTSTSTTVRTTEKRPQKTRGQVVNKKSQVSNSANKEAEILKNIADITEPSTVVRNLKVTSETEDRVTLTWKTLNTTNSSSLTVLYSKYGEDEMLRLSTDPSKNKVTIDGLQPGTKYMACVCPKSIRPKKDQCIVFSTDSLLKSEESSFQFSALIVVSSIACVIVLPIIFFLTYKVMKLQRKPQATGEDDLLKETYVKFETLSLRPRTINSGGELWTRRDTTESERLLLCSRSSMDSQGTFKSDGSRPEYYC
ncbi:leucine-rich repeat, immunoglobulin-like domain and transmembrane domain-containing protein 3 [Hyperolius riggenbachi]|uniref:leucine-rich repeat, immunoglobulin-like domain and transmembrane domain-containing protein 3 n=1 Tax=Hyperolius riggenbachi TaxID=752182 RepID=UPI0035A375FF